MVYLIENYQISWQEMLGCRNFPFGLNRTSFKSLGESFSSQWLKILESSNSELPMPWVTTRPEGWWPLLKSYRTLWSYEWLGWVLHNLLQGHRISGPGTQCVQICQVLEITSLHFRHDNPSDPLFWLPAKGSGIPKGHLFYNLETRAECGGMQSTISKTRAWTTTSTSLACDSSWYA